jgi:polyisoprenoid-binding protein YceI
MCRLTIVEPVAWERVMPNLETLLSAPATVGDWLLVSDRSTIAFTNRTLFGVVNVKGRFTEFGGTGRVSDKGAASGRLNILAASLDTGVSKRDGHLRSADFFHVERFPQIQVVVSAVRPTTDDVAEVCATLTVKESILPITVPATLKVINADTIHVSVRTKINRAQLGLSFNQLGMLGMTTTVLAGMVFARAI